MPRASSSVRLLAAALGTGLLAGFGLDLLTFAVARYGLQGGDGAAWSFRGNGALIVPFGLGPAILAGAWTALVLRARHATHWWAFGIWASAMGVLAVLGSGGVLITFGSAGQRVSDWLSLSPLGWMVVAPLLAAVWPVTESAEPVHPARRIYVVAGLLLPVALATGFAGAERVASPGA